MAKNMLYAPPNDWYKKENEKLIFLAGPIQGALNWQNKAIELISNKNSAINIANPRRLIIDNKFVYEEQVSWEVYHLRLASVYGAIMFWCAKEDSHNCDRSYAQTTRWELAEFITHLKYRQVHDPERPLKIILGIEPGFSGERYIRFRIATDLPGFQIYNSLEDTCDALIEELK